MLYSHYSEVPEEVWHWPNFTPSEIASKGDGSIRVNADALDKLQRLRELVGKPLFLTSAYRDRLHNARVGGAPRSRHRLGTAFDISLSNHQGEKDKLIELAKQVGFLGFGVSYNSFLHVDTGPRRQW